MESSTHRFTENVREAIDDANLRRSLDKLGHGFPHLRKLAAERLPEFEDLRDAARDIKDHVLANLGTYLEAFERRVIETGGKVHWARDAEEARAIILGICQDAGARTVTKSKSMIAEELAINEHLEKHGVQPIETDMGEYIIQLRHEPPAHILAPAIHLSKDQVADTFRDSHAGLPADRDLEEPVTLLNEARGVLREKFLAADVGMTGANFLVAETGSIVLVTNEGNADLTQTLPKTQIVTASIEKVVPTLEDATAILRVLARSATGQEQSVYTTFTTGPRRPGDPDGPDAFHVVLLDNGRSDMIGGDFQDMLRCIRCGACLNHCPVYATIGGHAYGWVYSGPMGKVLIPNLIGMDSTRDLPNASTLCGRCEQVCPMRIPLPRMLRDWRRRQFEAGQASFVAKGALKSWAFWAKRPGVYHFFAGIKIRVMGRLGRRRGRFASWPMAGGWTGSRDLPAPQGRTFQDLWDARGGRR